LRFGAALIAVLLTLPVFVACGVTPGEAWASLADGACGTVDKFGYVLATVAPLLLCAAGLLITFSAGLWNIGVEGQVVLGAIAAFAVLRVPWLADYPIATNVGAVGAALLAGALWALVTAVLKTRGKVHEIFGGLALNFVAVAITLYLILGPWKRPGVGSTGGTEPVREALWLPALGEWDLSAVELLLPVVVLIGVAVLLKGTYFGLRLKALGSNARAAERLGVPVRRNLAIALCAGGALAGLAGWLLVVGVSAHHNLHSGISAGYGYLGLLLVLLANMRARWCVPLAVLFAVLLRGGLQLSMDHGLDSAAGGVFQGVLVLAALLANGFVARWQLTAKEDGGSG
jgi:simple sugar transport system permease protein